MQRAVVRCGPMSDTRREMLQLVRALKKQGFTVERTGGGHWKVRREGGTMVIMAFSPRSAAMQKTLARLKEIGYNPK